MTPPVVTETSTVPACDSSTPLTTPNPKSDHPYEHLLPVFDNSKCYSSLEPFEHTDPGARAVVIPQDATRVRNLTPKIGTEVTGIDPTSLDGPARDELTLEVARRGVIAFRDQPNFLAQTAEQFREWESYFGRLLIHPVSGHPSNIPELHVVHRDGNVIANREQFNRVSTTFWHYDASYELQPPGLTTLFLFAQPSSGGDTLFVSQVEALKKLSLPFVAFLRTLKAVHSSVMQAQFAREGRRGEIAMRRDPVEHIHPVVRKHPVTAEEALFVNQLFTTYIIGLKKEESEAILKLLYSHIACVADAQVRFNWEPNIVMFWDNRVTAHAAIHDFLELGERRYGARLTPQAERPIPAPESLKLP